MRLFSRSVNTFLCFALSFCERDERLRNTNRVFFFTPHEGESYYETLLKQHRENADDKNMESDFFRKI